MMLYVNGQDIRKLVVGEVNETNFVDVPFVYDREVGKELALIERFLAARHASIQEILAIITVRGPGSATALRGTLSLLNTLAMSLQIPFYEVQKDPNEQDTDDVLRRGTLAHNQTVLPLYLHEARITTSTKDSLRRSI